MVRSPEGERADENDFLKRGVRLATVVDEIITKPSKTAMPDSAIKPTHVVMEIGISRSQSAAILR